ncbi:MAG: nitrite reductase/ring-hydroxylating ferredoxin subunit [Planctomycetota bacterium]|jgi:nitrite reductase/ring-hydroxylating ferredoxin subunit
MDPDAGPHDTEIGPEDLADGRPQAIQTQWGKFALYPVGPPDAPASKVLAAGCFCPHMDGPLFEGSVVAGEITCPWHLWSYSLDSGQCTYSPKKEGSPEEEGAHTSLERLPIQLGPKGTYLVGPPGE